MFRPFRDGETTCAPLLLGSLRAGVLLLADRNFAASYLAAQIAAARADFLIRARTGSTAPKLPILRRLPDTGRGCGCRLCEATNAPRYERRANTQESVPWCFR